MRSGYLSELFVSFQGEGAHVGYRHLFVRFAGCNLRCRYCDTPGSLERTATYRVFAGSNPPQIRPNPITAPALADLIATVLERDVPIDAIALTGGEPLAQSDFLASLLSNRNFPVPVLLETNGVLPRRLEDVLPFLAIISMDIKLASNTGEGSFWDEHTEFLRLARTRELYIKVLVDQMTADQDVARAAALIRSEAPQVAIFLQPIVDASGRSCIDAPRLTHLYVLARRELPTLRVLPQTHKQLGIL